MEETSLLTGLLNWLTTHKSDEVLFAIAASLITDHTILTAVLAFVGYYFLWPPVRYALRWVAEITPWLDDNAGVDRLDELIKKKVNKQLGLPAEDN